MHEVCFHFSHKDWSLLNVNRCTLVISCETSSNSKGKVEEEERISSNHVTVQETNDLEAEVEPAVPKTLEDGAQATIDELKRLNLGTKEDLRPIYMIDMLMLEEEKEYFKLLSKYRDVFTWSYKEMPGLDPKVAVHNMAIRKGVFT